MNDGCTLADWLSALGAHEWDPGINYRVEIDSFRWILISKICTADNGNDWCDVPTSLDDDGIATVWIAGKHDEAVVTIHGKIRDLLPIVGSATQVPFFFDEESV